MFDDDGNGELDREELTRIVMANHLVADPLIVKNKVETIMKQCDADGSGTVDRDEFIFLSKKFPNLLLAVNMVEG
jgi:Ca2+-binding EF-hand superfamily protein